MADEEGAVAPIDEPGDDIDSIMADAAEANAEAAKPELPEYADIDESSDVEAPSGEEEPAADAAGGDIADDGGDAGEEEGDDFPPELLADAGLTAEQARQQFGTSGALEAAIRLMDSRVIGGAAQPLAPQPPPSQPQPQQPAVQYQQQTQQQQTDKLFPKYELPKPANGEEWDEETAKVFNEMAEHHANQINQLGALLGSIVARQQQAYQAQQQEAARQQAQEFASAVDKLTDRFGDSFGSGLARSPEQQQNIAQLYNATAALANYRHTQRMPALPMEALVRRAAAAVFPEKQEAAIRGEVAKQVAGRQKQFVSRPSGRRPRQPTGEAAAAQVWNDFYRKKGLARNTPIFDDGLDGDI